MRIIESEAGSPPHLAVVRFRGGQTVRIPVVSWRLTIEPGRGLTGFELTSTRGYHMPYYVVNDIQAITFEPLPDDAAAAGVSGG